MEKLGLFSLSAVEQMAAGNEYIEYSEGCLLDNFIFWDNKTEKYFLCLAHFLTTWTACYEVYAEGGNRSFIFDMWDKLIEDTMCTA